MIYKTYYTGQRDICMGNWRASEASETLSGLFNRESRYMFILEKWFPLQGERAHSLNFCLFECMLIERKRRRGRLNNNYRALNFPRLYNSSQTTSPQPNTNFYHTQSNVNTLFIYIHYLL